MRTARFLNAASQAVTKQGAVGLNAQALDCNTGGAAHISVAIKAGSRYETSAGVSSMLAAARSISSQSHTSFLQTQQLAHAGASFTAENTRDHIVFTLTCGPKLIGEMFQDVVAPALFRSECWQWEVDALEHPLGKASASCMVDKLHSVSFKGSLANSNSVPAHRLGSGAMFKPDHTTDHSMYYVPTPQIEPTRISVGELMAHMDACYKHGNISIYTSGISAGEHAQAALCVSELVPEGGANVAPAASFVSGEYRNHTSGAVSGFVGFPGAAAGGANQAACAIIAEAMGGASHSYEGAGLVAIPTSDPAATVAALGALSADAIEAAKEACAVGHAFSANTFSGAVGQALSGAAGLDFGACSTADVQAVAASLAKGAKSLAVSGDLSSCPFVSEL